MLIFHSFLHHHLLKFQTVSKATYQLCGIICHTKSQKLTDGHFVTYVKYNGGWLHIDDCVVNINTMNLWVLQNIPVVIKLILNWSIYLIYVIMFICTGNLHHPEWSSTTEACCLCTGLQKTVMFDLSFFWNIKYCNVLHKFVFLTYF